MRIEKNGHFDLQSTRQQTPTPQIGMQRAISLSKYETLPFPPVISF